MWSNTFMWSFSLWSISKYNQSKRKWTIFSYLYPGSNPRNWHRLEKISVEKNLKLILIFDKQIKSFKWTKKINFTGKGNIVIKENVDILDWMGYYKYAKNIFTDSFHGTIFSIIFKKPFITLKNEKIGGERFISLLKPIGLIHRLLK